MISPELSGSQDVRFSDTCGKLGQLVILAERQTRSKVGLSLFPAKIQCATSFSLFVFVYLLILINVVVPLMSFILYMFDLKKFCKMCIVYEVHAKKVFKKLVWRSNFAL